MAELSDAVEFSSDNVEWSQSIKLSTGNIFIAWYDTAKGYFTIVQEDGTVVKVKTEFADDILGSPTGNFRTTLLNNGNVMILWTDDTDMFIRVYDTTGTEAVVKTSLVTGLSGNVEDYDLVTLDNDNVFIVYSNFATTQKGYYQIRTAAGVAVVGETQYAAAVGNFYQIAITSDGNVGIAYQSLTDGKIYLQTYDEDGVADLAATEIDGSDTYDEITALGLADGNILIAYHDFTDGLYQIRSQAGAEVKAATAFNSGTRTGILSTTLSGTRAVLTYRDSVATGSCKYVVLTQAGVIETVATEFVASSFFTNVKSYNALQSIVTYGDITGGSFLIISLDIEFAKAILKKKLVALANDKIFYEDAAGSLTEISGSSIDTETNIAMFEGYQKAFIVNDTVFEVVDFGNSKLSTADIVGGGVVPTKGMILIGGTSAAQMLVDFVTASTSAAKVYGRRTTVATFLDTETVTDADTTVSFVLDADEVGQDPPHLYTWTPYANNTTTYGSMPARATLGCLYRGRPVLAGNPDNPHQWYMARQADPWDWLYNQNDAQAPVAGNDADAGELGDAITCLIPAKDDFLIFGCASSVWKLNGDPAAGGSLVEVSLTTGIFGANSWCWDNYNNLYFLGFGGIYKLSAEYGAVPENISLIKIPSFPTSWSLNPELHEVTMEYDRKRHGLNICKTTLATGENENFWFDLRAQGFFPETYDNADGVYCSFFYNSTDPTDVGTLLGCKDGYIRIFVDSAKDDDIGAVNTAISSYIVYGPLLMGPDADTFAKITALSFISAEDTDSLTFDIFVDKKAEGIITQIEADPAVPTISGTISDVTRPHKIRQRARGIYAGLKLSNTTATSTWSIETIVGTLELSGSF